ncbi:MAG TPA: prolipoprotein diacylglyceryl transferase family protein [Chloroflexota bacterium]|nr:prolipoprotein diacylglyceryl transferase family protein [Chloroflexota bacterium]
MFGDSALLHVGPLELRWAGALLVLGLALGYLAVRATAARGQLSARVLHDAALWSLPEALLAARLAYVLGHPDVYLATPARVVEVWDGGYSFGAGLLVGAWALARYARRHGLCGGKLLDAAVPGLLIAQGLAALGRAVDVVTQPIAPLPPWDQSAPPASGSGAAPALGDSSLAVAPLTIACWALALLVAYAARARCQPAPGLVFRAYLLLEALGQIAARLLAGGAAPEILGLVAWAAVAVATALSALYHFRSAKC